MWEGPGELLPIVGYTWRLHPKGAGYTGGSPGGLFQARSILKGRENCHFSIQKGYKISCKVEEIVAKAKYIKGCHILPEITTQQNQNQNQNE